MTETANDQYGKTIEIGQMVKVVERPCPIAPKSVLPAYKGIVSDIKLGDDLDLFVEMWELESNGYRAARPEDIRVQRSAAEVCAVQQDVVDGKPERTQLHRHLSLVIRGRPMMRARSKKAPGLIIPPKEEKKQ